MGIKNEITVVPDPFIVEGLPTWLGEVRDAIKAKSGLTLYTVAQDLGYTPEHLSLVLSAKRSITLHALLDLWYISDVLCLSTDSNLKDYVSFDEVEATEERCGLDFLSLS